MVSVHVDMRVEGAILTIITAYAICRQTIASMAEAEGLLSPLLFWERTSCLSFCMPSCCQPYCHQLVYFFSTFVVYCQTVDGEERDALVLLTDSGNVSFVVFDADLSR